VYPVRLTHIERPGNVTATSAIDGDGKRVTMDDAEGFQRFVYLM
jgi:hypothetical protein